MLQQPITEQKMLQQPITKQKMLHQPITEQKMLKQVIQGELNAKTNLFLFKSIVIIYQLYEIVFKF